MKILNSYAIVTRLKLRFRACEAVLTERTQPAHCVSQLTAFAEK
jgi:hypothetical protein